MTERYFIEDQNLVKEMLTKLRPADSDDDIYIDSATGQQWKSYEFDFDGPLQEDYAQGLRRLPFPSTDEIISIAMTSKYEDEVHGASALLFEQEQYEGKEYREKLLSEIEKQLDSIDLERFEIIYTRTEIFDRANKREVFGKTITEIENDAADFSATTDKANEFRELIKKRQSTT